MKTHDISIQNVWTAYELGWISHGEAIRRINYLKGENKMLKTILKILMVGVLVMFASIFSACASFSFLPPQAPIVTDPQNRAQEVQSRDFEYCRTYGIATARTQSGAAVAMNNCLYQKGYSFNEDN